MSVLATERAYAKINVCLFLGPTRADGRHELVTLFDSVTLADELEVSVAGSADVAPRLAPVAAEVLSKIAAGLGADVPGQLDPGPSIGTGAGEMLAPLSPLAPYGVLVIPQPFALSTAAVYGEADRLGLAREARELELLAERLAAAVPGPLPGELIVNDLQPASVSLAPVVDEALSAAREVGADQALVCGSGPTVIGLFLGADGPERATTAARALSARFAGAVAAAPVGRGVPGAAPNK
jgi:4-diphosphocytidyl-2-C-methyl-D-erythritol kinase